MDDFSGHNSNIANLNKQIFVYFFVLQCSMMKTNPNPNFVTDIIDEMKKVSWPTRSETIRLTTIVIIVSLIIGLYVGIIDVLLAKGLEVITKFR